MSITSKELIGNILQKSKEWNISFDCKVSIYIHNVVEFNKISKNSQSSVFCQIVSGVKFGTEFYKIDIHIKNKNALYDLAWTISHELFHAWQFFNKPIKEDEWLIEGSAEYFAQLVTYSLGYKVLNKNYHIEYRSYFENIKSIINEIGWDNFLNSYFKIRR